MSNFFMKQSLSWGVPTFGHVEVWTGGLIGTDGHSTQNLAVFLRWNGTCVCSEGSFPVFKFSNVMSCQLNAHVPSGKLT